MNKKKDLSRRRFVTSAVSAGAAGLFLPTERFLAGAAGHGGRDRGLGQQSAGPVLL